MSGGWSRYTRKQAGGCGFSIVAAVLTLAALAFAVHFVAGDGTINQNMGSVTP